MKNKTIGQKKILAATMPEANQFWNKKLEGSIPLSFLTDFRKDNDSRRVNYHSVSKNIDSNLCGLLMKKFNTSNIDNIFAMSIVAYIFYSYNGINEDVLIQYNSQINAVNVPLRVLLKDSVTQFMIFNNIKDYVNETKKYQKFPVDLIIDNIKTEINVHSLDNYKCNYAVNDIELKFDFLKDFNNNYILNVTADSASYYLDSVRCMADKILMMLELCIEESEKAVLELDLFTQEDKFIYKLLNSTKNPFSDNYSLVDLIKNSFSKYSNKCAIIENGIITTYSEFEEKVKLISAFINEISNEDDLIIGILCDRSIDFLTIVYGILMAGKAYLPLDAKAPKERNNTILKQSSTKVIVYQDKYKDRIPDIKKSYSINEIKESDYIYNDINVQPEALAYIIFTSGSTGLPKGVCVNQRSVINRIEWMQKNFILKDNDIILHKTPATFDVSVWEIFWWAIMGGTVTLLPAGEEANPEVIIQTIETNSVTTMHFVPSMLNVFLDYVMSTNAIDRIKSLKRVFCSGEELKSNHVQKFYNIFNDKHLINLYGPTEATVDVSYHITKSGENPVPIGKPIDNIRLYILDNKQNKRPVGMIGELCISGVGVANGYINDNEQTNERFKKIPSLGDERIYFTGDLARIRHDKTIEYLGRNDRQVKVRGFRIELGEIEYAFNQQSYVSDVLVLTSIGTDNIVHLHAYVILNKKSVTVDMIKEDISKCLLHYMIPDRIVIIDSMPLTANGKVDRKALLNLSDEKIGNILLPITKEEKILSKIWMNVLGVEEVGINDNFFELGGNSINFVSVLALASEQGLKFTFQQLFKYPTISDLLNNSLEEEQEEYKEIGNFELISDEDREKMPEYVEDAYPMSMLQSGLVYQSTIMEGDNNYHDIVSYSIKGKIDTDLFSKAVEKLINTQPIFRTSYNLNDFSEYLQIVHKKVDKLPFNVYDLRGIRSEEEKKDLYQQWFWKEQHRPFNWNTPGLVQLHIHILTDELYMYSISQHNSALDGWSMNKVHTYLFETYFDMLDRKDNFEKKLSNNNHNKTFIYLEQKAINSLKFKHFWDDLLKDVPDGKIPRSRKENYKKGNEVIFHDIELPEGMSEKIIKLANTLKVPAKDILLASHIKFISLITRRNDVFTGYEIGGRPELLGSEDALGVFLNTMPFRVNFDNNISWKELIKIVYDTEAKVIPYRRYPMAKIKENMGNKGILFETVFNFTHFYSLKRLRNFPGFDMIDVRAAAITEFPLRVEYSRHFYNDKVELSLHYHTSKYDKEDIEIFGEIFIEILDRMINETNANHNEFKINKHLERFKIYENEIENEIENESIEKVEHIEDKLKDEEFVKSVENIKNIWAGILKKSKESIKLDDDFFLIGGSSLTALKVSLFLKNKVSLRTIMKKSRLYELAEAVLNCDLNSSYDTNILHCLTKTTTSKFNIIFLPYAGGSAINFMTIAKAFERKNLGISVYAAELPDHDANKNCDKFKDFNTITKMLTDEIEKKMKNKEYVIWGHCVGTSLALSVTNKLEKRGLAPKKLYLAGKTFNDPKEFLIKLENAKEIKFEDIRELYSEWSGTNEFSSLGADYENNLTKIFKHDADESNKFLSSLWNERKDLKVNTSTSIVITKDDPATKNYKNDWNIWGKWISDINLKEFENGGHYFINTIYDEVSNYILEDNQL